MTRFLNIMIFILMMLVVDSFAFNYEIVSDKESNVNFSKYKTYTIIHDDHGFEIGANPINKQRIDRAVEREFSEIGYEKSDEPDLQISWFIKVDTKLESGIYNTYYTRRRYQRSIEVYEYQLGSLVVDIVDAKTGLVIWHGKASAKVIDDIPDIEKKIKEVVKEIINSYKKDTGIYKIVEYVFK